MSDSQAAIKSLQSVSQKSKLAIECRSALNKLATKHRVNITWVPGHSDIPGNCRADELARAGTLLPAAAIDIKLGIPIADRKLFLAKQTIRLVNSRWKQEPTCRITRQLWPQHDPGRSSEIVCLSRKSIGVAIAALTGHWKGGRHAERMRLPDRHDYCRSCQDEGEEETIEHLFCNCPALAQKRRSILGQPFFESLLELKSTGVRTLMLFINSSKWFKE